MGEVRTFEVLELRPTQFAVGMRAVQEKLAKLRSMSSKARRSYLSSRPVPVIVGPRDILYMIDRHHLSRAVWELGEEKLDAHFIKDWSCYCPKVFWKKMKLAGYVYPYDQFGNGPHPFEILPPNVSYLADDPYRSLAKFVQKQGGYFKSANPFSEFIWANYFRRKIPLRIVTSQFERSVEQGIKFAWHHRAKTLPGHIRKASSYSSGVPR